EDPAAALRKLGGARVILATITSAKAMSRTIGGLTAAGKLLVLGISGEPIEVGTADIVMARRSVAGWPSGTSIDSEDTLNFSVLSGVRPMIETFPLERAGEAFDRMMSGKARFRVVLDIAS
ncbi:MAG TPA: alcohol dehydrogenase, partial [Dongiaceae bacterium]